MFKLIQGFCKIIDIGIERTRGKLTICPTPIGNLQDWTPRQNSALFDADVIACEDTRVTGMLMKQLKNTPNIEQDDDDVQDIVFKNTQELGIQLPELNKQFIDKEEFKFFKQKRVEQSKERIKENKKKQSEFLNDNDPLNFMKEDTYEDFEIYGITSPFITYLKNKIAQTKKNKGRGVLLSCHKFNEERRIDRILVMLKMGLNVTLVCEAGTPTISDPGYQLVNKCIERNIEIESLPGASSVPVALSLCGFPADQFLFLGFSSKTLNEREESLQKSKQNGQTTVLYESATRLNQLLLSIEKVYGEHQQVWLGFELTKMFEKKLRGRCRQLYEDLTNPQVLKASHFKGEVTVIIAPYKAQYNDDLRAQQIENTSEIKENEDVVVRKVEALQFAMILGSKVQCQDSVFVEILQDTLRLSKNKAYQLVKAVRHGNELEARKNKIRKELGIINDL
ncbi:hypothetical protein pb186bvf_021121 [Paramecium bursaria]